MMEESYADNISFFGTVIEESPLFMVAEDKECDLDYDTAGLTNIATYGLIDSHCHLDFIFSRLQGLPESPSTFKEFKKQFKDEFPLRSFSGCIAVFCEPAKWMKNGYEEMAHQDPNVWCTYGVHPHYADDFDTATFYALEKLLKTDSKVVALGEIGLDYSTKNSVDHDVQKRVFELQLLLARQNDFPICLHIRNADDDGLEILEKVNLSKKHKIHLHCFNGSWETCQRWLQKYSNLKVGFTPMITFRQASQLHKVVEAIPLERILLETDAPYFLPRQATSKLGFSHPGLVIHTAAQVAHLKRIPIEDVIEATHANVQEVYGIRGISYNSLLENLD